MGYECKKTVNALVSVLVHDNGKNAALYELLKIVCYAGFCLMETQLVLIFKQINNFLDIAYAVAPQPELFADLVEDDFALGVVRHEPADGWKHIARLLGFDNYGELIFVVFTGCCGGIADGSGFKH